MKKLFTYNGKEPLIFSLKGEDVTIQPSSTVELDATDEYVKTLIAAKIIVETTKPVPASKQKAKATNTKPEASLADDLEKEIEKL
jgi:hypothetical protein